MNAEIPKLLTTADIAEAFRCSRSQVMRKVSQGDIPAPTVDSYRNKLWHPADVNRWLDRRRPRVSV